MNESRKQIIINEIIYWKKNRLLPEHYCDFLLALYTKGNGLQDQSEKSFLRKNILLLFILIPIGIFLFYFTELSLTLQMVSGLILIIMGILLIIYSTKRGMLFQIPLIMTAFLLLFISVQITVIHTSGYSFMLYIVLAINCFIWLFTGIKLKQIYFSISGTAGLILLIFSLIKNINSPFLS
jgi:hypothetical protein